MSVLDAKLPAWQASTKAISPTKAEAKTLEGKAPLSVDGGGLSNGKRVLLKDQVKAEQNGLYEVTKNEAFGGGGAFAGAGNFGIGSGWTLQRTSDADSTEELKAGMLVPVEDGDTNQATSWVQRTEGAIEVGTTPLVFEALVAGARGNAFGDLEGLYAAPSIKEAVIDNTKIAPEAAIGASKLDLKASVAATDLAPSAKELVLQLAVAASRKVAFGSIEVEWPGSNIKSKVVKVSHGLGTTPSAVVLTANFQELAGGTMPQIVSRNASEFEACAVSTGSPGAGVKQKLDWLAIG